MAQTPQRRKWDRERHHERMLTDATYVDSIRRRSREYQRKIRKDPLRHRIDYLRTRIWQLRESIRANQRRIKAANENMVVAGVELARLEAKWKESCERSSV